MGAREREEEDRRRAEEEAKLRAAREIAQKAEREAAEARKREEDARRQQEAETKRRSEDAAARRLAGEGPPPPPAPGAVRRPVPGQQTASAPTASAARPAGAPSGDGMVRRPIMPAPKLALPTVPKPTRGAEQKNRGRLTVTSATSEQEERTRSVASFRRRVQRMKGNATSRRRRSPARS